MKTVGCTLYRDMVTSFWGDVINGLLDLRLDLGTIKSRG